MSDLLTVEVLHNALECVLSAADEYQSDTPITTMEIAQNVIDGLEEAGYTLPSDLMDDEPHWLWDMVLVLVESAQKV